MEDIYKNIPAEKFQFVENKTWFTKRCLKQNPAVSLRTRFRGLQNKGSIVGAVIILILVLYAILGTIFSQYSVSHRDTYFRYTRPRSELFAKTNFWDGCEKRHCPGQRFITIIIWEKKRGIMQSKSRIH